jgi:flagellar assembly factor FliW
MPLIDTRDFGAIQIDPAAEIVFPFGIPGFDCQHRFALLVREAIAPVVLLQSMDHPGLCFLTIAVSILDPAYQSGIAPEDLRTLGLDESRQPREGEEALYLAILSPAGSGAFTANLLAPVVIHSHTRVAVQAVRHDRLYSHRHPVAGELLERLCS